MPSLLRLERQQKRFHKVFLPYSPGMVFETINIFIHSCGLLENHTRFQTKMDKVYTRF